MGRLFWRMGAFSSYSDYWDCRYSVAVIDRLQNLSGKGYQLSRYQLDLVCAGAVVHGHLAR